MEKATFLMWLKNESMTLVYALVSAYEQRDKMRYIDMPKLEQEYMEKIGTYEERVIREEIENELLCKKRNMIQSAINRGEEIDEAKIDAAIDLERRRLMDEAMGLDRLSARDMPSEQEEELQELYKYITHNFHPSLNPNLTQIQRQLFDRATEAYRHKDLESMRLIHRMLSDSMCSEAEVVLTECSDEAEEAQNDANYQKDYTLVSVIYRYYETIGEENEILETIEDYNTKIENVMNEIEDMKLEFPFSAEEMLNDPDAVEKYLKELEVRMITTVEKNNDLKKEISNML